MAVSCLTDLIDGKIARHFNMISNMGKVLDPLADKATQITLILCLALKHPVLWDLVALFFVKETFQIIACGISLRKGKMLVGALLSGKICTTVLFLSLIIMILMHNLSEQTITVITLIDAAFMVIALVCYVLAYYGKNKDEKCCDIPEEIRE